jgi:hypothetical protein
MNTPANETGTLAGPQGIQHIIKHTLPPHKFIYMFQFVQCAGIFTRFTLLPVLLESTRFTLLPVLLESTRLTLLRVMRESTRFTLLPVLLESTRFTLLPVLLKSTRFTLLPVLLESTRFTLLLVLPESTHFWTSLDHCTTEASLPGKRCLRQGGDNSR